MIPSSSNKNTTLTIDEMLHIKSVNNLWGGFYSKVQKAREKIPKEISIFIIYVVEKKKREEY
jgi:hypothetical protein